MEETTLKLQCFPRPTEHDLKSNNTLTLLLVFQDWRLFKTFLSEYDPNMFKTPIFCSMKSNCKGERTP